jgi:transcriptional regulator with XRE-family HTH domain
VPALYRVGKLSKAQSAFIGKKVRILREEKGWGLGKLGELMDWPTRSTVSRAEAGNSVRQRRFTIAEVERLAAIFDTSLSHFLVPCGHCGGKPEPGFLCLVCEAVSPLPNQVNRVEDPLSWKRVRREILQQIESGVLKPGDVFSINASFRDLGASRPTCAKAVHELADEGWFRKEVEKDIKQGRTKKYIVQDRSKD